jgi:hypothetical protein
LDRSTFGHVPEHNSRMATVDGGFSRLVPTLLVANVLIAGCGTSKSGQAVGVTTAAIQGGTTAPTLSYSVAISTGGPGGNYTCSGTLLAPNLVISARHCFFQAPTLPISCAANPQFGPERNPANDFWVTTNPTDVSSGTGWHQGAGFYAPDTSTLCGADIALLLLSDNISREEAVSATPAIKGELTDASLYSTTIAQVGYGESGPMGMTGTRRLLQAIPMTCLPGDSSPAVTAACPSEVGTIMVQQEFLTSGGGCPGDSGDGAFDQAAFDAQRPLLLGVQSRAQTTCEGNVFERLDAWEAFIASAGASAAMAGGYDPDSWAQAGALQPVQTQYPLPDLGAGCLDPSQCASGLCESDDQNITFNCTQKCNGAVATSCPVGFTCVSFTNGEELCFPSPPTQGSSDGGCHLGPKASNGPAIPPLAVFFGVTFGARRASRRFKRDTRRFIPRKPAQRCKAPSAGGM